MQPYNDSKIDFQTFVFASADIVRALLLGESIGRLYNIESIEYKWRSRSISVDQCTSLGLLFQQKTMITGIWIEWMNSYTKATFKQLYWTVWILNTTFHITLMITQTLGLQ